MTSRRILSHLAPVTVLVTLALLSACASVRVVPSGRLTPVKDRVTDEAIERDLAVFDTYEQRVNTSAPNPVGAQKYLAARATEYIRIARDAYERNDRSDFVEDALAWAAADIETLQRNGADAAMASVVPMPKTTQRVNDALWSRAERLRRAPNALAAPDEIARAEGQLLRSGHTFLAGPACVEESPFVLATRLLDGAEQTRIPTPPALVPDSARAVPTQPPPAPTPTPTPPPPRDCATPDRLAGVPSIVHFALDRSDLSPETKEVLDRLVEKLSPYPGMHVVLAGHTDLRATDDYNQALSERRVRAVHAYLVSKGLAVSRLETRAFGEKRLLTRGTTVMDHARNRRVAVTYTVCDGSEMQPVEQLNDIQLEAARRKRAAQKEKD
jgi:outer membrane protein OmpA-like peptidoglycan-associated protein